MGGTGHRLSSTVKSPGDHLPAAGVFFIASARPLTSLLPAAQPCCRSGNVACDGTHDGGRPHLAIVVMSGHQAAPIGDARFLVPASPSAARHAVRLQHRLDRADTGGQVSSLPKWASQATNAQAPDQRAWPALRAAVPAGAVLLVALGYLTFGVFAPLTLAHLTLWGRLRQWRATPPLGHLAALRRAGRPDRRRGRGIAPAVCGPLAGDGLPQPVLLHRGLPAR